MAHFKLYLLGAPQVERNGEPLAFHLRKALALLVYLAVTRRSHSRDALATLFWPDKDQATARANLRRTLYDLGRLLGEQVLEVGPDTVGLRTTANIWVDVEQFQIDIAEHLPAKGESPTLDAACLPSLIEAADRYTDDFLAGFTLPDAPAFDDWQFFQREELRRAFADLLRYLVLTYHRTGKYEEALRYARRWLALDPLEEAVHRHLMALYAQAGQPAAAQRQYEECVRILAEELDAPPEEETTALYAAIHAKRFPQPDKGRSWQADKMTGVSAGDPDRLPANQAVTRAATRHLPAQTTPFVGRQQELAGLLSRLHDPACRLLTLVGPGGIGKTRLALAAAQAILDGRSEILDSGASQLVEPANQERMVTNENPESKIQNPKFSDGVYFVPLQAVGAPSGLIPAIADALGFQFYSGAPTQVQLGNYLHEKQLLLVLDNFEHLLSGAGLVADILAAAPAITLLVTSREALKLHEEWFHPLAGMRLPPVAPRVVASGAGRATPGEQFRSEAKPIVLYDAVQLFSQTARRAVAGFAQEAHQEQIARICQLVDGMPLAIELAASWLKVLSCAQIADELAHGDGLLIARQQNIPERHRSMRLVMEHSWQLLDSEGQRVLERLSVFQGGFRHEAAAAVAGATLLTLADLVDKAWVYHTPGERYQLHELLRQFVAEQLAAEPVSAAETEQRHAAYYLHYVAQRTAALTGAGQRAALDEIGVELDNIRAAWVIAVQQDDFFLVDQALQGLYRFFQMRSRYAEGEELLAQVLSQGHATSDEQTDHAALQLRLLARMGSFQLAQGELDKAEAHLVPVLRTSSDPCELATVYALLGNLYRWRGDRSRAEAVLQQSLSSARRCGDPNLLAETLLVLADTASSFVSVRDGRRFASEALVLCRQIQRPDLTAHVLASLAWATSCLGEYAEAAAYYRESLTLAESVGNPFGIALATQFLGWVAYCEGGERLKDALVLYERSIAIFRQISHRNHLAMALGDYALAAAETGDGAASRRYAQEGLAITEQLNHHTLISYNLYGLGAAAYVLDDLTASRAYLLRAVQLALTTRTPDHAAMALYWLARVVVKESQVASLPEATRRHKQGQALAWLALISAQPTTWQLVRDRAQRVQAELADLLPADAVAAALEQGKQRTFDEAVAALLATETATERRNGQSD